MTDVPRFEAFLLAHEDMVFATAVRLLGNAAEAEDIAARLGVSIGKIKTDIHRGRLALREALGHDDGTR